MRRLLLVVVLAMGVCAGDAQAQDRYALVSGCYALKSPSTGKFVAKTADGGYRATPARGRASRSACRPPTSAATSSTARSATSARQAAAVPVPVDSHPVPPAGRDPTQTGERIQGEAAPSEPATGA